MKNIQIPYHQLSKIISKSTKYFHMLVFVLFSTLIGFVIYKTGVYAKTEPTNTQVEDMNKKTSIKKVDQSSINKLKELESKNISLEALFDNGRTNPFEN